MFKLSGLIPAVFTPFDKTGAINFSQIQPYADKLDVVFNKPEWREGLKFLNKLYSEGLLDMEAFTQDSDLRKQKTENNQIGFNAGNAPSSFTVSNT